MYTIEKNERIRGDLKIVFKLVDDEISSFDDFSDIYGKVVSYPEHGALLRRCGHTTTGGYVREGYYLPNQSRDQIAAEYVSRGESKGAAYIRASEAIRAEMDEYESRYEGDSYYMAGIIVEVGYKGKMLGQDSVWGIELSNYSSNNEDYITEIVPDILAQAIKEAYKTAVNSLNLDAVYRLDGLCLAMDKFHSKVYANSRRQQFIRHISVWRKGMIDWRYKSLMAGEDIDRSRYAGRRISLSA